MQRLGFLLFAKTDTSRRILRSKNKGDGTRRPYRYIMPAPQLEGGGGLSVLRLCKLHIMMSEVYPQNLPVARIIVT
jgi:hypothetical protein